MSSTPRVKKRITPTSVVPVPKPRRIYDQKLLYEPKFQNKNKLSPAAKLSPASIFDLEIEKQLHNNSSKKKHTNDDKMIREAIQNTFNPHHLTAKSSIIRTQNTRKRKARTVGGKTRRRRNNK